MRNLVLMQGRNTRLSIGYAGAKPSADDPAHRYRFQILALNRTLDFKADAMPSEVLEARKDRVLAEGERVRTFRTSRRCRLL